MTTNSSYLASRIATYKLSSSYPNITPLFSKDLNHNASFSFNAYTKSWSNFQNIAFKSSENSRNQEMTNNSDLQPLTWLQKESIIDIDPLDLEDDIKDETTTPGYDDLVNPQITHAKVEVESQENSNIHDFVRFQAMRNSMNNSNRVALRNNNSFGGGDCNQNYSHQANGFAKPNLSYTQLIFMAIETCKDRAMTVNDIYQWCEINYPYYKHIGPSWKNSLRHNLSINKSFRRMPRDGQTSAYEMMMGCNDDSIGPGGDDCHGNNKQGGPGRGAYWVVDDKERKNLLDSLYRVHQTMPLGDRNGVQRVETPPYSLIVNNAPKNGPMLRIDGRFTDASSYLQSKRSDDELPACNENHFTQPDSVASDHLVPSNQHTTTDNSDAEYASMMYNLTASGSPDMYDASVKLSASYNSVLSRHEDVTGPENDVSRPKLKNRRKSKHEKVRNYEADSTTAANGNGKQSNGKQDLIVRPNQGMTSVNVIVAPHFDHIYARYQQFLPPAIASDMEKGVFAHKRDGNDDHDSADADADFLKHGYRDDDDDDDRTSNDNDDNPVHPAPSASIRVKLESVEPSRASLMRTNAARRLKLCWNGTSRLNPSSVAFTRQRKGQRATVMNRRRVHRNLRTNGALIVPVEVKREMVEPNELDHEHNGDEASDGYATDSTVPMVTRQQRLRRAHRASAVRNAHRASVRLLPIKRKAATGAAGPPEKRYRSKRKRTRPLRIDESHEVAAIEFLASLEKRHQNLKNIENLYNFNNYLKSSLSTGDSSCNSSVVLVRE